MVLEHDYHAKASQDVSTRANIMIWGYFIFLGILLFGTILGLTIYFRFQLQYEKIKKVGEVETQEVVFYKSFYKSVISGERGIFGDKKNISIDAAVKKFLHDVRTVK